MYAELSNIDGVRKTSNSKLGRSNTFHERQPVVLTDNRVKQLAPAKFKPSFNQPNPLIDGRRYWISNSPPGFKRGGAYWNSNDKKYNTTKDDKEVHVTIESTDEVNKGAALRNYVTTHKNYPGEAKREELKVGNRIDLSSWDEKRHKVNGWHISIKDGEKNVGGWFGIVGQAGMPGYKNKGHAATPSQVAAATTMHGNMNGNAL